MNCRRPSCETPLGPGVKKDGCFHRLYHEWRFEHECVTNSLVEVNVVNVFGKPKNWLNSKYQRASGNASTKIHVKTEKITSMKEVWIPGLNYTCSIDFDNFTSQLTLQFLFRLRRYIKLSRQCLIGYLNTSNFAKNTLLSVLFSTLFSLFGYPNELFIVFDILHASQFKIVTTIISV